MLFIEICLYKKNYSKHINAAHIVSITENKERETCFIEMIGEERTYEVTNTIRQLLNSMREDYND